MACKSFAPTNIDSQKDPDGFLKAMSQQFAAESDEMPACSDCMESAGTDQMAKLRCAGIYQSGLSTPAIIGICVGGIFALVLGSIFIYMLMQSKSRSRSRSRSKSTPTQTEYYDRF